MTLKGSNMMGGNSLKIIAPLNKDLSNEASLSKILLTGQYLLDARTIVNRSLQFQTSYRNPMDHWILVDIVKNACVPRRLFIPALQ